uniref:Uncharacterized protein n=1 Tax=Megaselia scalaris TaxID=36166 RepID=T1GBD1_MEGSC
MTRNFVLIALVAIGFVAITAQAEHAQSFEKFMLDLMSPQILDTEYANVEKKVLYSTT